MASIFDRVLHFLGLKKKKRSSSSRHTPPSDSRYTYERDADGRLLRHGLKGTERLGYDAWHPVSSKFRAKGKGKP